MAVWYLAACQVKPQQPVRFQTFTVQEQAYLSLLQFLKHYFVLQLLSWNFLCLLDISDSQLKGRTLRKDRHVVFIREPEQLTRDLQIPIGRDFEHFY